MIDWRQRTQEIADTYGDRLWFWPKQIEAESNFNPNAVSPAGARGIAQFMPGTAASVGVNLYDNDPEDDLRGSAALMDRYLGQFGNEVDALIAYNAGPARVTPGDPMFLPREVILSDRFAGGETMRYVLKILGSLNPFNTPPRDPLPPREPNPWLPVDPISSDPLPKPSDNKTNFPGEAVAAIGRSIDVPGAIDNLRSGATQFGIAAAVIGVALVLGFVGLQKVARD